MNSNGLRGSGGASRDEAPEAPAAKTGRAPAIVAIGTSAGGLHALRTVLAGLPPDLGAPVCVVQHQRGRSLLPQLLEKVSALPVVAALDGQHLQPGHVYVAPPDQHLIVDPAGTLQLTRAPRENFARPAIDPLFRSIAQVYGKSAIGVLLTGRLNDGTAGLYELKRHGGVAIVQDPASATCGEMPQSAIDHVPVDHVLPLEDIAACLVPLVAAATASGASAIDRSTGETTMSSDCPVAQTCPDCGGAMRRTQLGTFMQFRCHIGHRVSIDALLDHQLAELERAMDVVLRRLNERIDLCRMMRDHASDEAARHWWQEAMSEASARRDALRPPFAREWQKRDGPVRAVTQQA